MFLRQNGGVFPHPSHAAAPRILQLLPVTEDVPAAQRMLAVAGALKAQGGEMVVAGGHPRAEAQFRRAGVDHRPFSISRASLFQSSATQALLDTVFQRKLALIHVHGAESGLAAKAFAEAANLPLVMTCESLPRAQGFLSRRGLRKHISGRPVIVRSAFAAECLARDFGVAPDAIRVIAPGVDAAAYDEARVTAERAIALARAWSLADDARPVVLLPEARTDPQWLNWVLSAVVATEAADPLWLLVGDPAEAPHATRRIAQAGLADRVRWVDPCEDWPAAYKLASLVVSLPTAAPTFCDHALHAQAMGRPVVSTDSGAAIEAIQPGKTGWLVRHRDTGSLAYAVSAALDRDEILQGAMALAARNFILGHFSVRAMQAATLDVYREVLAARMGG